MLSLKIGDIILMTVGVAAMLFMILMGSGRHDSKDTEAEQRSNAAYLRLFSEPLSSVLVVALIIALAAVAYVLLGAYLKVL